MSTVPLTRQTGLADTKCLYFLPTLPRIRPLFFIASGIASIPVPILPKTKQKDYSFFNRLHKLPKKSYRPPLPALGYIMNKKYDCIPDL